MRNLTPYSVTHRQPTRAAEPDLTQAVEVKPVLLFGMLPQGSNLQQGLDMTVKISPVVETPPEVKEVESEKGSDDPKADSSVTGSVSPSSSDTSENGSQNTQGTTPIHPSTLQVGQDDPAFVVKELNLPPLPPS